MRVLHVISDENIGGAGVLLTTLLETMDRDRVQSTVALPYGSLLTERIKALGVPTRLLKYPCDRCSLSSVKEIGRLIRTERIDIVHANAAIAARIAGRWCSVTVVHTRHCCFPPSGLLCVRPMRAMSGFANRLLSDRVIATAEAAAENLRLLGIPNEKIELIINGSKPIRTVSDVELDALRKKLGLTKEDFCVGICARLEEYKGHDTFLCAAKQVLKQKNAKNIRFLIVGDGSMRETLERQVRDEKLEHEVIFTGFVADMAPIYRLLDLNVNCSRGTETSCLALSEGMSASLPFLATDYGGNAAMAGESAAGILYPVNDFLRLAELIFKIAADPALHARMRSAARARYEQKYTAEEMSAHLTAVYEELMRLKGAK